MYQIFVVEDELLIRQSIRNTVEQMQGPYSFCGEASDGEMALSIMQDLMPDILITDIRMPFLDGFGLITHAKAMMPWLKVIIISGYGDFEYARKAITLGVDQYLLKPVRPAEVTKAVEAIASQIEKEKAKDSLPEGFDPDEVREVLKKHFTQQLLYGGTDTAALLDQARTLQLDIVRSCYLVSVCQLDAPAAGRKELVGAVKSILPELENALCYFNAADQLTLLLCDNDQEELTERTYQAIQIIRHELKDICPVITAVVGDPVQRLGAIADSHKDAVRLLKRVSGIAPGQVISVQDNPRITADIIQFTGPLTEEFLQKISFSEKEDIPRLLDELLSGKDSEQFGSTLIRYNTLVSLLKLAVRNASLADAPEGEKDAAERLSEKYNVFVASGHYDSFRDTAGKLLEEIMEARPQKLGQDRYGHVISLAEEYVRENFCDPNISLMSVAAHVGMSSAHFSTVFSQHEGKTFISYLTSLRIERAKELLASTNMRLADIALEIGYNEPNYFSHVFRKSEGMTPKDYRSESRARSTSVN